MGSVAAAGREKGREEKEERERGEEEGGGGGGGGRAGRLEEEEEKKETTPPRVCVRRRRFLGSRKEAEHSIPQFTLIEKRTLVALVALYVNHCSLFAIVLDQSLLVLVDCE